MIRSNSEYQSALKTRDEQHQRLAEYRAQLVKKRKRAAQIEELMEPLRAFHEQIVEELQAYEGYRRGDLGPLEESTNLHGLGLLLVALRIARGITQRELATRLGVSESMVSRDERNDYHGVTVQRASKVIDALEVDLGWFLKTPIRHLTGKFRDGTERKEIARKHKTKNVPAREKAA